MRQNKFTINRNVLSNLRYYRMFALGCFGFLLAFVVSAVLVPVQASDALEGASTVTARNSINGYYISLTSATDLTVSLDAVPAGTRKASTDTITTITNVPTGYKLYISTEDNNIYNASDTDKVSNHFSPVSSVYPNATTLSANTWGFNLSRVDEVPDGTVEWSAVPTDTTKIKETFKPTAEAGDTTPISYGFMADTTLPAGTYSTTVTYTVYAENAEEFPYMQDFTVEECDDMQTNEITTLTDNRDGKSYRVTKYADGNCWMSQNLALDPVDSNGNGITLTTKNTNISMLEIPSGSYTFPDDTVIASGAGFSADTPQAYIANQNLTTTDCGSYAYCVPNDEEYGNYYNRLAATLGIDATDASTNGQTVYSSVCPKGWRLPDSGDYTNYGANAPDKSYSKLMYSVLGLTSTAASGATGGVYVKAVQQSPLFLPLAGYYLSSPIRQGESGYYWSRTTRSDGDPYTLLFNAVDGSFSPLNITSKLYGFSVRCVFEGAIEDNMNMQDITIDMCNNLGESTATADNRKTLIDSRDNKTYRVSKLADGNCWMVQNLALDGTGSNGEVRELTPADSDVTENRKLAANSTSGTSNSAVKIYAGKATDTTTSCDYAHCVVSDEPYGNLYNWFAATATTGTSGMSSTDAPDSICPKNWKLPTSGNESNAYGVNAPDKSYGKLMYFVLGFNAAGDNGSDLYVQNVQNSPLYIPLAGNFFGSVYGGQGQYGSYWSRVAYSSSDYAYTFGLNANSSDFYPQNTHNKSLGYSVRCVLIGS